MRGMDALNSANMEVYSCLEYSNYHYPIKTKKKMIKTYP